MMALPFRNADPNSAPEEHKQSSNDEHSPHLELDRSYKAQHLRSLVADSWLRSQNAGVDLNRDPGIPAQLVTQNFLDYRITHPLSAIMPYIRDALSGLCNDQGVILAITDENGLILWVEGDRKVERRAESMNFIEGVLWSEDHAGTNAPGTTIATGTPVQIVTREHFHPQAKSFTCSAAPIYNPKSGLLVGVVDLTGGKSIANPYCFALVKAAAKVGESALAHLIYQETQEIKERFLALSLKSRAPLALIDASGSIVAASQGFKTIDNRQITPDSYSILHELSQSLSQENEPKFAEKQYCVVTLNQKRHKIPSATPRLEALGMEQAQVIIDGKPIRITHRQSELLVLLSLHRDGLSAEALAERLYGDGNSKATLTTVRAEISRLRKQLGQIKISSKPYRLSSELETDFFELMTMIERNQLRGAVKKYSGPLLPTSDVAEIELERSYIENTLRKALLSARDPNLLSLYGATPSGQYDLEIWKVLSDLLPERSTGRAKALVNIEKITLYLNQ